MTHDHKADHRALEEALAELRAETADLSEGFLARIEADALSVQQEFNAKSQAPRGLGWAISRSGWGAVAGLAACLVLGIGLGGGFATQLGAFGDYYLSGGVLASDGVFALGYEGLLLSEEG